jgi:Arc/MetJ-type ribon-helix-helix transcriptional regulator
MQSLQIRLPEELLDKVDMLVEKGVFRSRSDVLRTALDKFISELNTIGTLPYIVGPFTPKDIEQLKKIPRKPLEISGVLLEEIKEEVKQLKV